jgi:hypothetical protein
MKQTMEGSVTNIILTAEYQQNEKPDYTNLFTDVIVQFDNGDKYYATFMSYKNLENMIYELDHSGEGDAYKVLHTVLVKDFNSGDIRPIIEAMLAEGDFQLVFKKM